MNPKRLFIAVVCLLLLPTVSHAQALPEYMTIRRSPIMQEVQKNASKVSIRSKWNGLGGNGIILGLLHDKDFLNELGVSDEQYKRVQETAKEIQNPQKNPEIKKIYEEIESIQALHGPILKNADEETKKKFLKLHEKGAELTMRSGSDALTPFNIANVLEVTLTPEQKQKMKEVQLVASLSDVSIFPSKMFEVLDLTDAQKQEMENIKKKLETEFEKPLEDLASRNLIIMNRVFDESKKKEQGQFELSVEMLGEATYKQITEDIRKIFDETESYGKQFATQFKMKMFDVLTNEQWARLQNLIDNPSGLVKTMQKKLREWRGDNNEAWQPGPNSWKPGDAIPEEYRKKRETEKTFPQAESTEPPS